MFTQVLYFSILLTTQKNGKMFSSVQVSVPSNWTTCAVAPGTKSSWLPRTASEPDASARSSRQRLMGEVRCWEGGDKKLLQVEKALHFKKGKQV